MKLKRRLLLLGLSALVIGFLCVVHFLSKQTKIEQVSIHITNQERFISDKELNDIFKNFKHKYPDFSIDHLLLNELSQSFEKEEWIKKVNTYVDMQACLQIDITQEEPALHLYTPQQESFYITQTGKKLKLSSINTAHVLACFNYTPNLSKSKDSIYLNYLIDLNTALKKDTFWTSKISHLNMSYPSQVQLVCIPPLPNVLMDVDNDAQEALARAKLFYEQITPHTQAEQYKQIDLRYRKQIIAIKNFKVNTLNNKQIVYYNN